MSDLNKAYTILGLEPGSSKEEIQKRYKRLALAWHPDRFPSEDAKADAEAELKKILNAKDLLIKHMDSGKHKTGACECAGKTAAAPQADTSPLPAARPTAAADKKAAEKAARPAAQPGAADGPSEEQRRRWQRLERQLEKEEAQQEQLQQNELLTRFFEEQKRDVSKPRLKPAKPRSKPTIQDQLNAVSAAAGKSYPWTEKLTTYLLYQIDECKLVLASPLEYFESMDLEGGFSQPIVFVALIAAENGVIWWLSSIYNPLAALIGAAAVIVASFALAAASLALSRSFGGDGDFEATYRACSAAMAPYVVLWVPLVNVFAVIYSLFLLKLGLERAQGLSPSRCNAVIGIQAMAALALTLSLVLCGLGKLLGSH